MLKHNYFLFRVNILKRVHDVNFRPVYLLMLLVKRTQYKGLYRYIHYESLTDDRFSLFLLNLEIGNVHKTKTKMF